jgi:hypothetical protein
MTLIPQSDDLDTAANGGVVQRCEALGVNLLHRAGARGQQPVNHRVVLELAAEEKEKKRKGMKKKRTRRQIFCFVGNTRRKTGKPMSMIETQGYLNFFYSFFYARRRAE